MYQLVYSLASGQLVAPEYVSLDTLYADVVELCRYGYTTADFRVFAGETELIPIWGVQPTPHNGG
jgi:hypothetical protein